MLRLSRGKGGKGGVKLLLQKLAGASVGAGPGRAAGGTQHTRLFGVPDLETTFDGCRFAIGIRNSNYKSMRLALTVGYRVFVCDNMAFHGDFTPVLAKPATQVRL